MHIKRLMTLACALALAAAGGVLAKEEPSKLEKTISELKAACKGDLEFYCSDVTPGEGRLAACLNARDNKLSKPCRQKWHDTQAHVSRQLEETEIAFRKSCGDDVKKFCSEVPSGRGRLLNCLDDHAPELSKSCKKFQAALDEKLAALVG
jgi:hypothetical protein